MSTDTSMQMWRTTFRRGVVPNLTLGNLRALRQALLDDDPRLIQGATTTPPPLACVADWPVEGACLFGLCGWHADGLKTVGEVEEFFAKLCFKVDESVGEPAACRWVLNWWDDTPREEAIAALLPEVELAITNKLASCA
jgi:hypothetical protein